MDDQHAVALVVNGEPRRILVESRTTLADFIRNELGLTGTHLACEHGVCGSCTVLLDGEAVRSCLLFAVQANGCAVKTVEGIGPSPGELGPVQQAFMECHGLQCGFCTPGFIVSVTKLLEEVPDPTDEEVLAGLGGNLCRCTGYQGIVAAVRRARELIESGAPGGATINGSHR